MKSAVIAAVRLNGGAPPPSSKPPLPPASLLRNKKGQGGCQKELAANPAEAAAAAARTSCKEMERTNYFLGRGGPALSLCYQSKGLPTESGSGLWPLVVSPLRLAAAVWVCPMGIFPMVLLLGMEPGIFCMSSRASSAELWPRDGC